MSEAPDWQATLEAFDTVTGAPFPFDVETVTDLATWEPKPRTVAVSSDGQFRLIDDSERTTRQLRGIVLDKSNGQAIEFRSKPQMEPEPFDPTEAE